MNNRAPLLNSNGETPRGDEIHMNVALMSAAIRKIEGKNTDALKLLLYLLSNQTNGTFAIHESSVMNFTGMSQKRYIVSRRYLCERGFIGFEPNARITINYDAIMADEPDQAE